MARLPTTELSPEEVDAIFLELDIWSKIGDGRFSSEPILRARAPSRAFAGGTSDIVRHRNQFGFQVATTHRITMPDGSSPHWHAKDLRVGDVILWRGGE